VDAGSQHHDEGYSRDGDANGDIVGRVAQAHKVKPGDSDGRDGGVQDSGQGQVEGDGSCNAGVQQKSSNGVALSKHKEGTDKGGTAQDGSEKTGGEQGKAKEGGDTQEKDLKESAVEIVEIKPKQEPEVEIKVKQEPGVEIKVKREPGVDKPKSVGGGRAVSACKRGTRQQAFAVAQARADTEPGRGRK